LKPFYQTIKISVFITLACFASVTCAEEADAASDAAKAGVQVGIERQRSAVAGYLSLDIAGQAVDASYLASLTATEHGAVLVLHDAGAGFDSRGIIETLKQLLPNAGWSVMTVALDYPQQANVFLADDKTEPEIAVTDSTMGAADALEETNIRVTNDQRIDAAVNYLQEKTPQQVVIIGHRQGALTALPMIIKERGIDAFISLALQTSETNMETLPNTIPWLDIVAPESEQQALRSAVLRNAYMKQNNMMGYSQRLITGAGPDFSGQLEPLKSIIHNWLYAQFVKSGQN